MSKIYLEVQVPGNAKTYEFAADSIMTVGTVKRQMIDQIAALENRSIFPDRDAVLFCSIDLGQVFLARPLLRQLTLSDPGGSRDGKEDAQDGDHNHNLDQCEALDGNGS